MQELLIIALGSALVNNVVLGRFLGVCPFLGVSRNVKTAAGMGFAVVFVMVLASFLTGLVYNFILVNPAIYGGGLYYLQTVTFILIIAGLVQFVEMLLKKYMPLLYKALGVFLPLITTNCAVLGVALINVQNSFGVLESVINGLATAIGFMIAIIIMAGIREKTEDNDVPAALKGTPIVLITAGIMAMAFVGFGAIL